MSKADLGPQTVEMTVVAQDPTVRTAAGRILTARVRVPAQRLEPGPTSARFRTVDYDATIGELGDAAVLTEVDDHGQVVYRDAYRRISDRQILEDPVFHAQNVFAIAARTLAAFESALGRRLPWSFGGHQLYLVPHAFAEANAYYSDDDRALLFGYFDARGERVFTCLSHDVVAHETAHAVLDGLRHRFLEPSLPDQAAFHEAMADIVALLSVFSVKEVVNLTLGEPDGAGRIDAAAVSPGAIRRSLPLVLAEQMGGALLQTRGGLRRSAGLRPPADWRKLPEWEEPHRRGEVLVAAVLDTLVALWVDRVKPLIRNGELDRDRAGEEGAKSASHLLGMTIRAIDYLPPVDFAFGDFLEAILRADAELAPDDPHGYRVALRKSFERLGIHRPPPDRVVDLATVPTAPRYHGLNFAAMRTDVDEVFRFIWENADWLELDPRYYTRVESVRPAVRVGPDGLVANEAVADYIQLLEVTADEFVGLASQWAKARGEDARIERHALLKPDTRVQLVGGGTLVFDQFGRAKYHIRKPLEDWRRQARRLDYLARTGMFDSARRVGFSTRAARGQRFAALHLPAARSGEEW
ncbi:MAG TPA: hypothetical protein VHG90_16395 [Acidimicrobiales bacterium]|nr:hypothetical protein [Acidimicrobiales bacterium]